jgi:predicted dehydrogenase
MPGTLRIGIIGAGGIAAKLHLPELAAESSRAKVTLVAGRKESRLRTLCDTFGVPRFTRSYDDVIADDAVDAVIIATPHPSHVEWGVKALRAGKHVYMQKPLSGELADADTFVAEADRHPNRTVFCLPHVPDAVHTVRKLLREGAIGKPANGRGRTSHGGPEVYYREVSRIFGEPETKELWFFDAKEAGVGALFDMGVYAVAHLVALLGTVTRVSAVTATIDKPTTLEDTATLVLQHAGGAVSTAETSWCDPARSWAFSVHGTAGKYEIDAEGNAVHSRPSALDSDSAEIVRSVVEPTVRVGNSHTHWLDCVAQGAQPPVSNPRAARHVTEILLAGLEAGQTGRAVDLRTSVEG